MSQPEISRRCLECGAAVRAGARFCPQCGRQMEAEPAADAQAVPDGAPAALRGTRETAVEAREAEAPAAEAPALGRQEVEAPAVESPTVKTRTVETSAVETAFEAPAVKASEVEAPAVEIDDAGLPGAVSGEEARGRVARVREGARERVGVARGRVGRMRDDALVALEEPADDSGLRFVLTAAALFLLFLIILLLSTLILR